MKTQTQPLSLALLLASSVTARAAAPMNCFDGSLEGGTNVRIETNVRGYKDAFVERVGYVGAEVLAQLSCEAVPPPAIRYPDQLLTTLSCKEERPVYGYSVVVREGGFAGITQAVLSEKNTDGTKPDVFLNCR